MISSSGLGDNDSKIREDAQRKLISLHLAKGYQVTGRESKIKYITAIARLESEWLDELREALGLPLPSPNLPAMISGMDAALAAELREVKKSRKAYVATDGQPLGIVGGYHLYSFQLEDPWEPQDDAPIRVVITEQTEISASVVSSSGNKITIAVESSLSKSDLRKVELKNDPSGLLERLRDTLREAREPATQLASKIFDLLPAYTALAPMPVLPTRFEPNESQQQAMKKALGNETTFIIGPPGTGKTATLAAIAHALVDAGKTVLIAAHTNIAVDNAILKLADFADEFEGLSELREGKIVRFGPPQLAAVREDPYIYPPNIAQRVGKKLEAQKASIHTARAAILAQLDALAESLDAESKGWRGERTRLLDAVRNAQAEFVLLQQREQERVSRLQEQLQQALHAVDDAEDRFKSAKRTHERLVNEQTRLIGQRDKLQTNESLLRSRLLEAKEMNFIARFVRGVNPDKITSQLADLGHELWKVDESLKALLQPLDAAHTERAHTEQARDQAQSYYSSLDDESRQPSPFTLRIQQLEQSVQTNQRRVEEGDRLQEARDEQKAPEKQRLQEELDRLNAQLADVEAQLRDLEQRIVAEAQVVATTLAKVYMGSALKDRQFDAVIIDEVSIAPLPSVYIAASHATARVVAIGDPKQLAPIVIAKDPIAIRWLGRDLFDVAGATPEGASQGDPRSVLLDEQFRMNPAISVIARKHVYRGLLRDAPQLNHDRRYENIQPMPGRPLVLCDTGDANPWQDRSSSGRLNMYHINCVLTLAKQVLATLPPALSTDNNPRIGIATPYRRQANELLKQIRANKLADAVRAGTVHKFQGLEFEVVIFDTVESRGANISEHFSRGEIGSQAMRLVNVAVTRPQHKLIIVANLQWLRDQLSLSDTLRLAVEEAAKAAIFRSGEIVPL